MADHRSLGQLRRRKSHVDNPGLRFGHRLHGLQTEQLALTRRASHNIPRRNGNRIQWGGQQRRCIKLQRDVTRDTLLRQCDSIPVLERDRRRRDQSRHLDGYPPSRAAGNHHSGGRVQQRWLIRNLHGTGRLREPAHLVLQQHSLEPDVRRVRWHLMGGGGGRQRRLHREVLIDSRGPRGEPPHRVRQREHNPEAGSLRAPQRHFMVNGGS